MAPHLRLIHGQAAPGAEGQTSGTRELTNRQRLLVKTYLPLVERCATGIVRCYAGSVRKEELLGPGTLALYEAAGTYQEELHPDFGHYAAHHVRGRMLDALREDRLSTRAQVERAMERGFERFASHQTVDIDTVMESDERIDEEMERGCDDLLAAAVLAGLIEAQNHDPEELLVGREEQARTLEALKRAIDALPAHERQVIQLVYEKGRTLDEVARETSVHPNTAQRRHVEALRKLRATLVHKDP